MKLTPRRTMRFAIAGCALALVSSCSEGKKQMAPPPPSFDSKSPPSQPPTPPSPTAQVWTGLTIPGVDLFIDRGTTAPYRAHASARVDGKLLTDKAAFDATRTRVNNDPVALATLSMLFLDGYNAGKLPWTKPTGQNVPNQQAIAQPPTLSGDTLVYWRQHEQLADLVRCTLTLSTGQVACQLGGELVQAARVAKDPDAVAAQALASDDIEVRIDGIVALGASKSPQAHDRLIDIALNAQQPRERGVAVETLGKVGGRDACSTISRALLFDRFPEVRQAAAIALGELRDPAGRPALEKASTGDANGRVQVLAAEALKKL